MRRFVEEFQVHTLADALVHGVVMSIAHGEPSYTKLFLDRLVAAKNAGVSDVAFPIVKH